ncbi:hypothetical protein KFU94_51770 [Chloroflexi bacterium TSY]|nr:hypothetical protein [Chloroflexi bacterium TSY]
MLLLIALFNSVLPWLPPTSVYATSQQDELDCEPEIHIQSNLAEGEMLDVIYDGDESTYLELSAEDVAAGKEHWNFIQFDFGCPIEFEGLRRYVTEPESGVDGDTALLFEGIAYSLDGVQWIALDEESSSGWTIYNAGDQNQEENNDEGEADSHIAYQGYKWEARTPGWTEWLEPNDETSLRYVRYNWITPAGAQAANRYSLPGEFEFRYFYSGSGLSGGFIWDRLTWDWTRDTLIEVRWEEDNGGLEQPISLPWHESDGECYQEGPDIHPGEGWRLLDLNFGHNQSNKPKLPYFVLYNQYRGIMRAYFFNAARDSYTHVASHQVGKLVIESSTIIPSFAHYIGKALPDFKTSDAQYEQIFIKQYLGLNSWACLEFDVVGYDPDIAVTDKDASAFYMRFLPVQIGEVDLNGKVNLSGFINAADMQTGQRSDPNGGQTLDDIKSAGKSFLKAVGIFSSTQKAIDEMKKKGDGNQDKWWGRLLSAADDEASGTGVPLISAAAGFITSLIDSGNSSSMPLSWRTELSGELEINGTITFESLAGAARFYIPGTNYGNNVELRPLYHQPLGVYSLKYPPRILWWMASDDDAVRRQRTRGVKATLQDSWVHVNPHAGLNLHAVEAALVGPNDPPTPFVDPAAVGNPRVWMSSTRFESRKVGLKLTFNRIDQPDSEPIIIYREYEPERVFMWDVTGPQSVSNTQEHQTFLPLFNNIQ